MAEEWWCEEDEKEAVAASEHEEVDEDEEDIEEECDTEETRKLRALAASRREPAHQHELVKTVLPYGADRVWVCDVCSKRGRQAPVYHCAECEFDLCAECHAALKAQE